MQSSNICRMFGIFLALNFLLLPQCFAQIVNHGSDLGYGYGGGIDAAGRAYSGNGGYYGSGIDPNGRRYGYGGASVGRFPGDPNYPGLYGDTAFSYNRPNGYYGRDRYYGYYNEAIKSKSNIQWITVFSLLLLFLKHII